LLASNGILDKPSQRSFSNANLYFFTPCLIFSKLGGQLRWSVIKNLWAIPVLVAVLIGTFPQRGVIVICRHRVCYCSSGEQTITTRSTMGKICSCLYYFSKCTAPLRGRINGRLMRHQLRLSCPFHRRCRVRCIVP
jgi:hypothetical protein